MKKFIEVEKYPNCKQSKTMTDFSNSAWNPTFLPSRINELVIDEETTNNTIDIISE